MTRWACPKACLHARRVIRDRRKRRIRTTDIVILFFSASLNSNELVDLCQRDMHQIHILICTYCSNYTTASGPGALSPGLAQILTCQWRFWNRYRSAFVSYSGVFWALISPRASLGMRGCKRVYWHCISGNLTMMENVWLTRINGALGACSFLDGLVFLKLFRQYHYVLVFCRPGSRIWWLV